MDNNLAVKIARGLNEFVTPDHKVSHLKDHFPANTDDCVWMTQLANQEGWIVVTADVRIGKNPHEVAAWQQAGHAIFFLKPGWLKLRFWDQAQKFVKCFPDIIHCAANASKGASFLIGVNGKIDRH